MKLPNLFKRKQTITNPELEAFAQFGIISDLTDEQRKELAQVIATMHNTPEIAKGDGKATFIEAMTDEEYATWEHEQDQGWRKVYDKFLKRN